MKLVWKTSVAQEMKWNIYWTWVAQCFSGRHFTSELGLLSSGSSRLVTMMYDMMYCHPIQSEIQPCTQDSCDCCCTMTLTGIKQILKMNENCFLFLFNTTHFCYTFYHFRRVVCLGYLNIINILHEKHKMIISCFAHYEIRKIMLHHWLMLCISSLFCSLLRSNI